MFKGLFKKTGNPDSNIKFGVLAIVVNFHTEDFLQGLLKVLSAETAVDKIVIANNGDKTDLHWLAVKFRDTEILHTGENIGFGAAVNRVAEKYQAEYYLIINPDTLPEPGFAAHLLEGAKQTTALIAGPRFYWDDEKTFRLPPALGYSLKTHFDMQLLKTGSPDAKLVGDDWACRHERFWNADEPFNEPFLSGGCMLIKNDRSFFTDGIIFDERFFLYYEETDLCFRANSQNKSIVVIPEAEVVHYWDQSPSGEKNKLMAESHDKFMLKHYGGIPDFPLPMHIQYPKTEIFDLGEIETSTSFSIDNDKTGEKLFFEIGLNPHFVPFAQADVKGTCFQIPKSIINRLKPGEYYSRMRNSLNKTLKIWKWRKF